MQQLSRAHQGGEQITSLSRQVLGNGWKAGVNSELGPRWIICSRGLVTDVLRGLTWDTPWDLDMGECPWFEAVVLLSKKGHSHDNVIRSQCRYFRWLASFFTLHFTHSLWASPFFRRPKELSGSLCPSWRTGQGVSTLRMDRRVPFEDVWRLGAVFQALIKVMAMCSRETHKCKHAFVMGYMILHRNVSEEGLLVTITDKYSMFFKSF